MNKQIVLFCVLSIMMSMIVSADTKKDLFLVGVFNPGLHEYQIHQYHTNISGYKPIMDPSSNKLEVTWWFVTQTGAMEGQGKPGYAYAPHGAETNVPGVSYEEYEYPQATWIEILAIISSFLFLEEDKYQFPFLPPILITGIQIDCEGDGTYEVEKSYFGNKPIASEHPMRKAMNAMLHTPGQPPNAYFQPPDSQQIEYVTCFYDYDSTAVYKFTANLTARYYIQPNYWSIFGFSAGDRGHVFPGQMLSGNIGGYPLSKCGTAGSYSVFSHNGWIPAVGCVTDKIVYRTGINGFEAPYNIPDTGGNGVQDVKKAAIPDEIVDPLITDKAGCDENYADKPNLLEDCYQRVAAYDMRKSNETLDMGISIIRMVFSFLLLGFYILSITIIGYMFAVLIPGMFRKIMIIFDRAARLK